MRLFMKIFADISYVMMSGILIIGCAGILKQDLAKLGFWKTIAATIFIGLSVFFIKRYYPEDK